MISHIGSVRSFQVSHVRDKVDFAIITIREDEFAAVLRQLPMAIGIVHGRREYNLRRIRTRHGDSYVVAVIRCAEQGNGEAQAAANDLLEELRPGCLLVVGIAGAVPSHEVQLGDVVVSTRIVDFSVEAAVQGQASTFAVAGGPAEPQAGALAANLRAREEELGSWNQPAALGLKQPPLEFSPDSVYGDDEWQQTVCEALSYHLAHPRPARVTSGSVASSDRLVKDAALLERWLSTARQILAMEMEFAGVYRAAHSRSVSALAIRGISDIVGFKRDPRYTRYACATAASFTRAFLETRPVEPKGGRLRGWLRPAVLASVMGSLMAAALATFLWSWAHSQTERPEGATDIYIIDQKAEKK